MPNLRQSLSLIATLLLLGNAGGCGGQPDHGTVSGTLTYDGKPVPMGTKVFFELEGKGAMAVGQVQEGGTYSLNYRGKDEIRLGEYAVFVGPPSSQLTQGEFLKLKAKVDAEYRAKGKTPPPSPDWVLPEAYYTSQSSPLRATVVAGDNTCDFALED